MKFLLLLLLVTLAWRLFLGNWPWQALARARARERQSRSVRFRAAAQARDLLGIGAAANREEIIEAHRRLIAMVHPDRGGSSELVHEANAARDLLLAELARIHQERS